MKYSSQRESGRKHSCACVNVKVIMPAQRIQFPLHVWACNRVITEHVLYMNCLCVSPGKALAVSKWGSILHMKWAPKWLFVCLYEDYILYSLNYKSIFICKCVPYLHTYTSCSGVCVHVLHWVSVSSSVLRALWLGLWTSGIELFKDTHFQIG